MPRGPTSSRAARGREPRPLVLAIDDEPLVHAYLRRVLAGLPIRLVCVDTAEGALAAIEAQPPAAIVSDHGLPGMSGIELLEQVRTRWPRIPVLLHTGDPAAQARASRLRLLAMEKGAPPQVLRAMVLLLLDEAAAP
jgi:CheY-like chemotaxis protein